MIFLTFDTCLEKMYVALGTESEILDSRTIKTTQTHYHSAFLISTIQKILSENNLTPQDVDVIATNIGPGSFTGIRACTTVARVFAQGQNAKTIGISSLEILSRLNNGEKPTLVALDARKEMVYAAIYDKKAEVMTPKAVLVEEIKKVISKNDYHIITDDKMESALGGVSYQKSDDDLGKILIEIAREKISSNADTDWRKLHPLYIQPPPVTIKANPNLTSS